MSLLSWSEKPPNKRNNRLMVSLSYCCWFAWHNGANYSSQMLVFLCGSALVYLLFGSFCAIDSYANLVYLLWVLLCN
jgi:hypothetical protein